MALDWKTLIKEHAEWEGRNFPSADIEQCLMGIQEELGELTHHRLKRIQGIRGPAKDHFAGEYDAVGDMVIYLLGVMHHGRIPQPDFVDTRPYDNGNRAVLRMCDAVAYVSGAALGDDRAKQLPYAAGFLINKLEKYSEFMGWNFEQIVTTTWAKVKQRDWVADPVAGVTAEPAIQAEPEVKEWEMGRGK